MIRRPQFVWFMRFAAAAALLAALSACSAFRDESPPTLAVTVIENGSAELRVQITARDPESGVKRVEVLTQVGDEDPTVVHSEAFQRDGDHYPFEVSAEVASVPVTVDRVIVQAANAFDVVGESVREVAPDAPVVTRVRVSPASEAMVGEDLEVWVTATSGVELALLEVSLLVNGSSTAEPVAVRALSGARATESLMVSTSGLRANDVIEIQAEVTDVRERSAVLVSGDVLMRAAPPAPESSVTIDALVLTPSTTLALDGTLRVRLDASSDVSLRTADLYLSVNDGEFDWVDDRSLSSSSERVVFDVPASAFEAGDSIEVRVEVQNVDGKRARREVGPVTVEVAPVATIDASLVVSPAGSVTQGTLLRVRVDAESSVPLSLVDVDVSVNDGVFSWVDGRTVSGTFERVVFDLPTASYAAGTRLEVRVTVRNAGGAERVLMAAPVTVQAEPQPDASITITALRVQPSPVVVQGDDVSVVVDASSAVRLTRADVLVSRNDGPWVLVDDVLLSSTMERARLTVPTSSYANGDSLEIRVVMWNEANQSLVAHHPGHITVEAWAPSIVWAPPSVTTTGMLYLVFDADTASAALSVSVRVQGQLLPGSAVTPLVTPGQWQVVYDLEALGLDPDVSELLVRIELAWDGRNRALNQPLPVVSPD